LLLQLVSFIAINRNSLLLLKHQALIIQSSGCLVIKHNGGLEFYDLYE